MHCICKRTSHTLYPNSTGRETEGREETARPVFRTDLRPHTQVNIQLQDPSLPSLQSCDDCNTADFPTVKCTLTDSGDAYTVTQTDSDGQEYCFIQMPGSILGRHCSVIKAVRCTPHGPLPSAAAHLTFKAPIQFCSEEPDDK